MTCAEAKPRYAGILLAAGRGWRFDPEGRQNKLLQTLPDGTTIVAAAARHLQAATDSLLAVVPADSPVLSAHLSAQGCAVTKCAAADTGMAASLVHALRLAHDAPGWIIALGDMPFVSPDTIRQLAAALAQGADIAVPVHQGMRGNPVAFSRRHLDELLQLRGDIGARRLMQTHPVHEVPVSDPGILRDIDTASDLEKCRF
ncbi:nucleotidyltransferase family protein [Noviherbaspirillum cavernae]|uniref:Nucleotidyltransferase family protein n=1 Tax=Noviherbaspirillum cavernae TaxID=2320862 RepID=A0A418WV61_9BURK|nr:nucleotidyltransferase family protein [Noviherbaspirillum cavernae]RJF96543.1 nucleotidyltransferase family protein [Noviherbaspirillum cavernae]